MSDEETLLADGFEAAFDGYVYQFNRRLAVYDYEKCVDVLVERDGMTWEEATEFMDVNVVSAYVGEYTPVFRYRDGSDELYSER